MQTAEERPLNLIEQYGARPPTRWAYGPEALIRIAPYASVVAPRRLASNTLLEEGYNVQEVSR